MDTLYLHNIASTQIKLSDITIIKCSGGKLSESRTAGFLASITWHYFLQKNRPVLFAVPEYFLKRPPISNLMNHKGVYPYLIERKHSLYQLTCYLDRLRDEGVQIGLVILSAFEFFHNESLIKTKAYNATRRMELKRQSAELYGELKQLSSEHGCHFLLRIGPRGKSGGYSQGGHLYYSLRKIQPSLREQLIVGGLKMNLFEIESNFKGDVQVGLSIRDHSNQGFLHFPSNLIPYLE